MPLLTVETTGTIKTFAGSYLPKGYLVCDGTVLERTEYPSLFAVIGTVYNTVGETSNQFRLPDLRGKLRVGQGEDAIRGISEKDLGEYVGAETHVLNNNELPLHKHSGTTDNSSDAHTHTGTSGNSGALQHTHNYLQTINRSNANNSSSRTISSVVTATSAGANISMVHNHNVTVNIASNTHAHDTYTTSLTGGNQPHNNIMPFLAVNYCIKY